MRDNNLNSKVELGLEPIYCIVSMTDRMEWQAWCKSISSWVLTSKISELRKAAGYQIEVVETVIQQEPPSLLARIGGKYVPRLSMLVTV